MNRSSVHGAPTTTRSRACRVWAALLAVAMIAAGCSGDDSAVDIADAPAGDGDVIELLAEAGIAVVPDGGGEPLVPPNAPVTPLQFTEWEADNLWSEARRGGGMLGSEIDELVPQDPAHPQAPAPSQVLAAYVHGVDTAGAEYSRQLMEGQDLADHENLVFPGLVKAFFSADMARVAIEYGEQGTAAALDARSSTGALRLAAAAQPVCPDFSGYINRVLGDVLQVLKVDRILVPDTGIPVLNQILQAGADLFVGFLNFAIDTAAHVLIGSVRVALHPVFSVFSTIGAVLAVTNQVVQALRPWTLHVEAADTEPHRGVGEPGTVEVTARVEAPGPVQWPVTIASCARAVGIELPALAPHGGTVTWDVVPEGLAHMISHDATVDDTSHAVGVVGLGMESPDDHARGGPEQHVTVDVRVQIRREQVEEFEEFVRGLIAQLFSGVPDLIAQHLTFYSAEAAHVLLDGLAEQLVDVKGSVFLTVGYHGPARPEEPAPAGTGSLGSAPAGCPGSLPGHGTRKSWGEIQGRAAAFPPGVVGCPYATATWAISVLALYSYPTVETDVPGQLLMVGLQDPPFILMTGWERVDVVGAESAWLHQHTEHVAEEGYSVTSTKLLATVGDRSLYLDLYPPAGGPEHVRVAEYLLALD